MFTETVTVALEHLQISNGEQMIKVSSVTAPNEHRLQDGQRSK